jgi:hypothetical protein
VSRISYTPPIHDRAGSIARWVLRIVPVRAFSALVIARAVAAFGRFLALKLVMVVSVAVEARVVVLFRLVGSRESSCRSKDDCHLP